MYFKKGSLVFVVAIILLFSLASMVLAAPPLQTPDDDGTAGSTLGDTLNLDNVKSNLGTVMSGKGSENDADDPAGEEPDGETPPGDQPEDEEPPVGDPADDDPAGEEPIKQHPVASALAEFFGVDYDEL